MNYLGSQFLVRFCELKGLPAPLRSRRYLGI